MSIARKLLWRVLAGVLVGLGLSGYFTYNLLLIRVKSNIVNNLSIKTNYIENEVFKAQQLTDLTKTDILVFRENGLTQPNLYDDILLKRFKNIISESDLIVAYGLIQKPYALFKDRGQFSSYYAVVNQFSESKIDKKYRLPPPNNNIFRVRLEDENYVEQAQYSIMSRSKEPMWFPIFYWNDLQSTMYITPILDNKQNYLGSVSVTLSLEPLKRILNDAVSEVNNAGFFVLLDRNGTILYHPNIDKLETKQTSYSEIPELKDIWGLISTSSLSKGEYEFEGNLIVYEKIEGPNWILVGIVSKHIVSNPIILITLFGLLGIMSVVTLSVILLSNDLNRRLQEVVDRCLTLLKRDLYRQFKQSLNSVEELQQRENELDLLETYSLQKIYEEYVEKSNKRKKVNDEIDYLALTVDVVSERLKESIENLDLTVQERTEKLEIERDRADEASQAKSQFLASVSHELRSPLNSIIGYTEFLLRSRKIVETEKPKLEIINNCSYQLLGLINELLDITRIETKKLELVKVLFSTKQLLKSVLDICYSTCSRKGIEFIYIEKGEIPLSILSDEKRIRQVLINLLSNSMKFTKQGSVTFTVEGEKHENKLNSYLLTFTVEDTGVGIPESELESIFLPFEQSKQTKKRFEGTGLGLNISKRILKELGTDINVESEVGVGSKFWFTVLLEGLDQDVVIKKDNTYSSITSIKGDSKKILVIDDIWENRLLLLSLLDPLGFVIIEAENGIKALELLESKDINPDLIICDLAMPELDGFGFLIELNKNKKFKDIPVIISSASVFDSDRLNSIQAGAVAFIPKPISYIDLLNCIKDILNIEWNYLKPENKT